MASLIAGHGHGHGRQGRHTRRRAAVQDLVDPGDHRPLRPWLQRLPARAAWRGQRELANAIKYAVRHGAKVISMSLGYAAASGAVRSALQSALAHNVVVVASSGNAGATHTASQGNAPYSFPADYPGVIGVAAVAESGRAAYFSSENLSVQVAAPGVNVPAQGRGSKYWVVSGTSPGVRADRGGRSTDQGEVPEAHGCPGQERDHRIERAPAARRLRRPGRIRHGRRGGGAHACREARGAGAGGADEGRQGCRRRQLRPWPGRGRGVPRGAAWARTAAGARRDRRRRLAAPGRRSLAARQ